MIDLKYANGIAREISESLAVDGIHLTPRQETDMTTIICYKVRKLEKSVNDDKIKVEKIGWEIAVGDVVGIGDLVYLYVALTVLCKTPHPPDAFWGMLEQKKLIRRTLNEHRIMVPAEEAEAEDG